MKKFIIVSVLSLVIMMGLVCTVAAEELTAEEIIKQVDYNRYPIGSSFKIQCQMYIYRGQEVESRKDMEIYVQNPANGDGVLVKFVYPSEDYGKAVLSIGDQNWLYFPNTRKTIRIAPQYALMGGDFSNGDITKLRFSLDYIPTIEGEEEVFGFQAYVIDLKAKSNSATYRHVKLWVGKDNLLPLKQEIYSLNGRVLKTMVYLKFEEMDGVTRPVQMMMTDALRQSQRTVLVFKSIEKMELPDSMFTKSYLETSN